jgi:hypothetical protein
MTERSRDRGFDHAVMVGNLSDLTTEQRGQYYHQVCESLVRCHKIYHIPSDFVVACVTPQRKPPEVRIWRLRNQSCLGTVPPSTSTPHCPAWWARRW